MEVEQYVIDSEREYINLCKNLEGILLKIGPTSNTYINILEIRENSCEEGIGYLATKISRLIGFFNLIFGKLNEEKKSILEEKLIELYSRKGISFDDESLFYFYEDKEKNKIIKKFKESMKMPILEDLYNLFNEEVDTQEFKIKLIPFVKGSLKFFNNYTNVLLENK